MLRRLIKYRGLLGIGILLLIVFTLCIMVKSSGIQWDKLIWVFLISAFLGDVIETLYCWAIEGVWMSRSSVLYGPFSIVWGIGAVVLTVVLSQLENKPIGAVFLVGAFIGGIYEYVCSWFTEITLGSIFWDYSWMPLNIGGRTNLLYMAFWGALSVIWVKWIYPKMSRFIDKLPVFHLKYVTRILAVFMICNTVLSAAALIRYTERKDGVEASNMIDQFIDENYEDSRIEKIWPNMMMK